jgi:hypothetical protein
MVEKLHLFKYSLVENKLERPNSTKRYINKRANRMVMSIKTKYTGIFLALVLISGFATECNGDGLNTATKNTAKKDAASRSNAVSITYSNRSIDFGKGWKFALVNPRSIEDPTGEYKNAQNSEYDDSAWRVLDVPHDWSIELLPTADADANTDSGTGYLQGGLGLVP